MSYVGLKKYRNQAIIKEGFGTNDIGYINICKDVASLNLGINVLSSNEGIENKIGDISLIYSHNYRGGFSIFGSGIRVSNIITLSNIIKDENKIITSITVNNPDYTTHVYTQDSESIALLKCQDTDNYIIVNYELNENETEIINTTVKLYDQSGNYYQFNCLSESTAYYPELLHKASFKEDENILFTYDASYNITMEYKTQKIVIARLPGFNRINSVSFYNSDKLLTKVIFDYSVTSISSISKYFIHTENEVQVETLISKTVYAINDLNVDIKNDINKLCIKYELDSLGKVIKVTKYVENNFDKGIITTFDYFDGYTKITDYKGNIDTYYFKNNLINSITDMKGRIKKLNYDSDKRLVDELDLIDMSEEESIKRGNLLTNGYHFPVNSYEVSGLVSGSEVTKVETDEADVLLIYNDSLDNDLVVSFTVDNLLIEKDNTITFIGNVKKKDDNTSSPLEIKLSLLNPDRPDYPIHGYYYCNEELTYLDEKMPIALFVNSPILTKRVIIDVTVPPKGCFMISEFQLYNHLYGKKYIYNKYGVISNIYSSDKSIKRSFLKFDNRLALTSNMTDYNSSINCFDSEGNLIEVLNSNGTRVLYEYDSNNKPVNKSLINQNNRYYKQYTYYTDEGNVYRVYDNGMEVLCEYEKDGRVINKITYPNLFTVNKKYNDDLLISEINKIDVNDETLNEKYYYNNKKALEEIKINNIYSYYFDYDIYGNITDTYVKKLENNVSNIIDSVTYEEVNDVYTNNMKTHMIGRSLGENNKYEFEYDNYDRLIKIYLKTIEANQLLYNISYDNNDNVVCINDYKENINIYFIYDKYNNLIEEVYENGNKITNTKYVYDANNVLIYEKQSLNEEISDIYGYNTKKKKSVSPVSFHNYYKNLDKDIYTCMLLSKDQDGNIRKDLTNYDSSIKVLTNDNIDVVTHSDNITKSLHLESNSKGLAYELVNEADNEKTVAFWFKLENYVENEFFFSMNHFIIDEEGIESDATSFEITCASNNRLKYGDGLYTNPIVLNKWNFISISYRYVSENESRYVINLNGTIYEGEQTGGNISTNVRIGIFTNSMSHDFDCYLNGYITCLLVSNKALSDSEINRYYVDSSNHYINYGSALSDENYNQNIVVSRYNNLDDFLIIPLENSLECINGDINYVFEKDSNFNNHLEDAFKYDSYKVHGYGFLTRGHKLVYDINSTFTTCIKALKEEYINKHIIMEAYSGNDKVGIYISSTGEVCGYINNSILNTGYVVGENSYNNYYMSFSIDNFNEQTREYVYKLGVKINDSTVYYKFFNSYDLIDINKLSIGRSMISNNPYIFDGLVNMLCISDTSINLNSITCLDKTERYTKIIDNMGFLNKEEVLKDDVVIYNKEYKYKEELVENMNKCYNVIEEENFYTNTQASSKRKITYVTDLSTGRVIGRKLESPQDDLNNVSYEYSPYGFLVCELDELRHFKTVYSYDNNGNITRIEKFNTNTNESISVKTFNYDTLWPDRLKQIYDNGVMYMLEYDESLYGMPVKLYKYINNEYVVYHTLEWFRSDLTKYTLDSSKYLEYKYDANGLRIEKKLTNNQVGGYIKHNYRYSQGKLIEDYIEDEIKGEYSKIKFLYDEVGLLYGFEYDNEVYYYLRDALQTIIGIINENKEIVCEYEYDAWGNHKVLNGNRVETTGKNFIGNINPFRYKGYYYDEETGYFWLSSRYYSPELGRFIQPADVSTLNPYSINGLNLYAYASNNSIGFAYRTNVGVNKVVPKYNPPFNVITPVFNQIPTNNSSFLLKPLTFSIGMVTPDNPKLPKWIDFSAFYISGDLGFVGGYSKPPGKKGSFDLSLASLELGIINMKCDVVTFDDDTSLYLGLGAFNANASLGLGLSANVEIISYYFGAELNEYVSIDGKVYVGWGISFDFSKGIKIGIATGVGFEISLSF